MRSYGCAWRVCIERHTKYQAITSSATSQSFKTLQVIINFLFAKNHRKFFLTNNSFIRISPHSLLGYYSVYMRSLYYSQIRWAGVELVPASHTCVAVESPNTCVWRSTLALSCHRVTRRIGHSAKLKTSTWLASTARSAINVVVCREENSNAVWNGEVLKWLEAFVKSKNCSEKAMMKAIKSITMNFVTRMPNFFEVDT